MIFHTFYTSDLPKLLIDTHREVCKKIGLIVNYHQTTPCSEYNQIYSQHGKFMNYVIESSRDDVVGFLDIDCLPHNYVVIRNSYDWVRQNNSFIGNAQNISHTVMRNHIYAAASFLIVSKNAWELLDKPDFRWGMFNNIQIDTAQVLTIRADQIGLPYRLMFPVGFDEGPAWELGSYGLYGVGTHYPATWHYTRISKFKSQVPELFLNRAEQILNGEIIVPKFISNFFCIN